MIIKKYIILFVVFQFLIVNTYAQKTVKEILDKSTKFYEAKNQYNIDMKFTMHRGISRDNPTESYNGNMQRKGTYIKNVVLTTTVYQFNNIKIIVDESTKTIVYEKMDVDNVQNDPLDLSAFLKQYKKSQVLDNGDEWICEMVSTQKNFVQTPYGKVLIHVAKNDYEIKKQILFFSNRIPFKTKEGTRTEPDFGRLVIDFSYHNESEIEQKVLDDFIIKSANNSIQLKEDYKSYQLIDQTKYNK